MPMPGPAGGRSVPSTIISVDTLAPPMNAGANSSMRALISSHASAGAPDAACRFAARPIGVPAECGLRRMPRAAADLRGAHATRNETREMLEMDLGRALRDEVPAGVNGHGCAAATEQLVGWAVRELPGDVPERDLDAAHRLRNEPGRALAAPEPRPRAREDDVWRARIASHEEARERF